ncbi:MAG: NAD(P)/FAD-dependent oxidoreductase [Burkholderiaceae bacterium]|nr:NAD(P)/FAD-dependent oxidoreductase [Burkholderiaceae bacterium]
MPDNKLSNQNNVLDVVVIGAGFAGVYALYRLRKLGFKVRVYEAASGVGGTWFWNKYPGARCDVESTEYSYSFSKELEQEWNWTERYAGQPEILRYINHVVDRYDLSPDIQLNTRITSLVYTHEGNRWAATTDQGDVVSATFCVMATGNLSVPKPANIKGLESFSGDIYHTGLWPSNNLDLSGKRVGVIGTGSSGIQAIPLLAEQAEQLYVFQRSPNYCFPARNRVLEPEYLANIKANYPTLRATARNSASGNALYNIPQKPALSVHADERLALYEERWSAGGLNFLRAYTDLVTDKDANKTAQDFIAAKIQNTVDDSVTADALIPRDHYLGSKRPCTGTNYYETYNRNNVTLVNVRSDPITQIVANGIQTEQGQYDVDVIVLATGFDAITGALKNIAISVDHDKTLAEAWVAGPKAYLGLMTAGFPNFFLVTGPGSPSILTNMLPAIEQHVDWIGHCLQHLRTHGFNCIDVDAAYQNDWAQHLNEQAAKTLLPLSSSWYVNRPVAGEPLVFPLYVGSFGVYTDKCDQVAADNYTGFILSAGGSRTNRSPESLPEAVGAQ